LDYQLQHNVSIPNPAVNTREPYECTLPYLHGDIQTTGIKQLIPDRLLMELTSSGPSEVIEKIVPLVPYSSTSSLLKFASTWVGPDLEECLEAAYSSRSTTEL